MHGDFEHSQPMKGHDIAESKTESLRSEIHGLGGPHEPHRDPKSSAPSSPYVPRKEYRAIVVSVFAVLAVAVLVLWRWPLGAQAWEGIIQPAQSRILNAPHAGRWVIAPGVALGDEVPAGKLLGRVEDPRLREAIATKEIELRAAEAVRESLSASAARQKDAHAAAIVDHQRSEITKAELTDVEIALRDVSLRLALAESSWTALRDDLARLQRLLDREQVVAPQAGAVLLLNTRSDGTYVAAGELLAEVGSREVVLHFDVPESQMSGRLKVGRRVSFTCAGLSERLTGTIERIEPRLRQEERGPLRERLRYGLVVVKPLDPLPDGARPGLLVTGKLTGWLR